MYTDDFGSYVIGLHVSGNNKDVQVCFCRCFPGKYLHRLHNNWWSRKTTLSDIVCFVHLFFITNAYAFRNFTASFINVMWCFQEKFSSLYTPKYFVTFSVMMCTFSINKLGKVCGRNFLFVRGWNNEKMTYKLYQHLRIIYLT